MLAGLKLVIEYRNARGRPEAVRKSVARIARAAGMRMPENVLRHNAVILEAADGMARKEERDLLSALERIDGVSRVRADRIKAGRWRGRKPCHIFFDIDSTLTHGGLGQMDHGIKKAFSRLKGTGHQVYFCTGRSGTEVAGLVSKYGLGHPYSIAEGGGIILGVDGQRTHMFGSRDPADALLDYLDKEGVEYALADEGNRRTEVVLDKASVAKRVLNAAIRATGNKAEVHTSKTSYHITKKGANKGSAIRRLLSGELHVDRKREEAVGVGDSELDEPMFEECDRCFTVEPSRVKGRYKTECASLGRHGHGAVYRLARILLTPRRRGRAGRRA